jgi:hypothetical protein
MRLEKTDRAYSRSRSARVQLHVVRHPEVESLFGICKDFSTTLRANGADGDTIVEGRTQLFRLRRLVTGLPLAFNDPEMHISEICDALKKLQTHPNYLAVKQHLTQAINICEVLQKQQSNPIDESLRNLAEPGALVLTKDAHTSSVLKNWLKIEFPSFPLEAVNIGELKKSPN